MTPSRRDVLLGTAALSLLGLPLGRAGRALADEGTSDLSFLFVFAPGGWDPTRVFAPAFGRPEVDLEPDAEVATAGNLRFVDHASRPAVRSFFQQHHDRMLVINGLQVPSIDHTTCTRLVLTGEARDGRADWPATIAHHGGADRTLPHLVLGGPTFPGTFSDAVVRAGVNGQLEALLSSDVVRASVQPTAPLPVQAEALVDRFLARRAGARVLGARTDAEAALLESYRDALDRAVALKDLRYTSDFATTPDLAQQVGVAADALSQGLCRCASVVFAGSEGLGWDSHADNDATQAQLFEGLFDGLERALAVLDTTPGRRALTLADETVVVVLSEMGRTPKLNGVLGKDHWPTTSGLLLGPGLTTDRVVGGFDEAFSGERLHLGSGEVDDGGQTLVPKVLGATLLRLAGLDAAELMPGVPVLDGILT